MEDCLHYRRVEKLGQTLCQPAEHRIIFDLQLIAIRMSITLIGCASYLFYTGDPNPILGPPEVRKLLALRGFIGFFGLVGM